jgi:hypothetical protein
MTASGSCGATCCPARAVSRVTTPAIGAVTVCSIFIASTTSSGCPMLTCWPCVTSTEMTVPGMGERTAPSALPARLPSADAASSADSAQA